MLIIDSLHRAYSSKFEFVMKFLSSNFRDDFVALGADDDIDGSYTLLVWDLRNLTVIHAFKAHLTGIFQIQTSGDHIITRDKDGHLVIWDANLAANKDYVDTEDNIVLMRKLDLSAKEKILCIDADLRRLAVGKIGGTSILDFWNTSESTVKGAN